MLHLAEILILQDDFTHKITFRLVESTSQKDATEKAEQYCCDQWPNNHCKVIIHNPIS